MSLPPPKESLCVATGAALGGLIRHMVTRTPSTPRVALIRVAAVNVAGSFLFGAVGAMRRGSRVGRGLGLALSAGFCGGLTTFSSFTGGVAAEGRAKGWGWVLGYVVVSCTLGVGGVIGGEWIGKVLGGGVSKI